MFLPRSYTRHARNINAKRESLLKLAEFSVELSGVEFTSKFYKQRDVDTGAFQRHK